MKPVVKLAFSFSPGRLTHPREDDGDREDRVPHPPPDLPYVRRGRAAVGAEKVDPLLRQRHRSTLCHLAIGIRSGEGPFLDFFCSPMKPFSWGKVTVRGYGEGSGKMGFKFPR